MSSPDRGRGRPVEVDPDAIAVTALRLFAERGIDGVTMSEIAAAAGIGRRTLFRWFPTKAALVWGGTTEMEDRFEAAFAEGDGGDILERVQRAYVRAIAPLEEAAEVTRLRLRLIDGTPQVFAWGAELRAGMEHDVTRHFAEAWDAPADSLRVVTIAAAFGAAAYRALVWWAERGGDRTPQDVVDEALTTWRAAAERGALR
jgi:AcrR family transcriptional regulator